MQKLAARSEILDDVDQAFMNLVGALNASLPFHATDCISFLQRGRHNEWIPLDLHLSLWCFSNCKWSDLRRGSIRTLGRVAKRVGLQIKNRSKEALISNRNLCDSASCKSS